MSIEKQKEIARPVKERFLKFLKEKKVHDEFISETSAYWGSIDKYFNFHPYVDNYPGSFIRNAFIWVGENPKYHKKRYDKWYAIEEKWLNVIHDEGIKDKTEWCPPLD